jgi:hypothetical protein
MSSTKVFRDTTTDYEQILSAVKEHFDEEKHMGDETWFYDAIGEEINAYVERFYYEAKIVVDSYGVFDAISLYKDQYGEFEIEETNIKNYLKLYYVIIDEEFMRRYRDELEDMANEEKNMKKRIEDQFKMIEELKKENEELKKKVAELTPAPTPRRENHPDHVNEIAEEPKKKEYRCPCGAVLSQNDKWYITNHEKRSKGHQRWVEANKK